MGFRDLQLSRGLSETGFAGQASCEGLIQHLGVTNFDVPRLCEIVEAGIPVVSHQVQLSLLDRRPHHGMIDLCRQVRAIL